MAKLHDEDFHVSYRDVVDYVKMISFLYLGLNLIIINLGRNISEKGAVIDVSVLDFIEEVWNIGLTGFTTSPISISLKEKAVSEVGVKANNVLLDVNLEVNGISGIVTSVLMDDSVGNINDEAIFHNVGILLFSSCRGVDVISHYIRLRTADGVVHVTAIMDNIVLYETRHHMDVIFTITVLIENGSGHVSS